MPQQHFSCVSSFFLIFQGNDFDSDLFDLSSFHFLIQHFDLSLFSEVLFSKFLHPNNIDQALSFLKVPSCTYSSNVFQINLSFLVEHFLEASFDDLCSLSNDVLSHLFSSPNLKYDNEDQLFSWILKLIQDDKNHLPLLSHVQLELVSSDSLSELLRDLHVPDLSFEIFESLKKRLLCTSFPHSDNVSFSRWKITPKLQTIEDFHSELQKRDIIQDIKEDFLFTGKIVSWTVPVTGLYQLEAWGAQGGSVTHNLPGYEGAYVKSFVNLEKDTVLKILVGGEGSNGSGGGGSFITKNENTPLAIAGGGGGAGGPRYCSSERNSSITFPYGQSSERGGSTKDNGGGSNGFGGSNGKTNGRASGGGGLLTDGENGDDSAKGGSSFKSGGSGGAGSGETFQYQGERISPGSGGFGGGGGCYNNNPDTGYFRGGGGGGYSGGQGGTYDTSPFAGGGGGSYSTGSGSISISGNCEMPNPNGGAMKGKTGNGHVKIILKT